MQLQELKKWETRLSEPISIPVIGRCLQKKAVAALAEDDSPDAVKVLAKAVTHLKNEEIKEIVLDALGKLKKQECIDAFCQVWADTRYKDLTNLLVKKVWVASAPVDIRVLTALKAKQLQVVTNGGKEIVEPLLKALNDKNAEIAHRANECLLSLSNSDAIDYICHKWAETRDKLLEQLVCQGKYIAVKPIELKVLTALKLVKLEVIRDGGQAIVEPLLKAFNDRDFEIINRARKCVISLTNPEAIDYICSLAIEQNHQVAYQIALNAKYLPKDPIQKALFYFMTEQWEKYESLDFEQNLLQKAHELANEQLRKRIAEKIRQAGNVGWLKVIVGGHHKKKLEAMTDVAWETTILLLSRSKQWKEMWRLAQKAPAIWCKHLLKKLNQVAWLPTVKEERAEFERLNYLADKCLEKIQPIGKKFTHSKSIQFAHTDSIQGISFSADRDLNNFTSQKKI